MLLFLVELTKGQEDDAMGQMGLYFPPKIFKGLGS